MTKEEQKSLDAHVTRKLNLAFHDCVAPRLKEALIALKKLKPKLHKFAPSFPSATVGSEFTDKTDRAIQTSVLGRKDDPVPCHQTLGWWMWQMRINDSTEKLLRAKWQPEPKVMELLHTIGVLMESTKELGVTELIMEFVGKEPRITRIA